jgi:UDP-glucose 4-epimerase
MPVVQNALVTGPHGFLGTYVCARLAAQGYRVAGVGLAPASATAAAHLASFYELELPSPQFAGVLDEESPALIVHTAAPASVGASVDDSLGDFSQSVETWFRLLDSVRYSAPRARVILVSSAAVYGNPVSLPVSEGATIAPVSPYGFHKWMCEVVAREHQALYGMQIAIARVFSAYGRGLRRQVVWDTCVKLASEGPIVMSGSGDEARDFVHGADVAQAIALIAEHGDFGAGVYNVASGHQTTVRELVEALVGIADPGREIRFSGQARAGDPDRSMADTRAIEELGFATAWDLASGLADYTAWFGELDV